ncbi:MAG: 50S ribosomal protein L15 [Chloroflexota bacterium]
MKLHELHARPGSRRRGKRVGRGISAGQGKTAGRGTKGQGARSGEGGRLYRQGGNLPFYRSLPFKRGFTHLERVDWHEVNLDRLVGFEAGAEITPEILHQAGLIGDTRRPVVILGRGKLEQALTIKAHRVTSGARTEIERAGGKFELLEKLG